MGEQLIIVKKIKFQKKLSLNKETVAKLNEEQMEQANGGASYYCQTAGCAPPPSYHCPTMIDWTCAWWCVK
jgi:hypothetical protein